MALALREENFVIIDVGSQVTRAGMGTLDTNKTPTVTVNMADFNYPLKNDTIVSWEDLEACWHHILFKELGIKKSRNEHAVLLSVPTQWSKFEHERITQIFFEKFNVPGIYLAPQPLLALYGCGSVSGVVVDIGEEATQINVVIDSLVQPQATITVPVGGKDFSDHLLRLMKNDASLVQQFEGKEGVALDKEFARFVKEQKGVCNVFVGHDVTSTEQSSEANDIENAAAAATEEAIEDDVPSTEKDDDDTVKDVSESIEIEYKGYKFNVGSYRHQVYDPLFDLSVVSKNGPNLIEALRVAASHCEPPEIRPKLWESMALCGGGSLMTGLQPRIRAEVVNVLPCSENIGDAQPRQVGFLRIPDYFTVLKDRTYRNLCTWLGGEIVAKLVFVDAKNYVSKVDYNESGPSVIHTSL
ncbi:actin family [Zychaea mexicana]|uniref:actin family n=1 Tax=Zychaea mexicana TaxID=64656 RepID=UPI0022FE05ED|nr:actin family [Zychaea mexicana]KAI9493592.1 actin family [Zychaea mexicana]